MTVLRRRFVASLAIGATSLAALLSTVAAASVRQQGAPDAEADALVELAAVYQAQSDNRRSLEAYRAGPVAVSESHQCNRRGTSAQRDRVDSWPAE